MKINKKIASEIIIMIGIMVLSILACYKSKGVDTYYIIVNGKNALKYGLHTNDLLLHYPDLYFINQHWLTSVLYVFIDKFKNGFAVYNIFCAFILNYALYKVMCKISKNNILSGILIAIASTIITIAFEYYQRPMLLTAGIMLIFIYFLEDYYETGKKKYFVILMLLSILEINLHCSMWWMLPICILPYICNFKIINKKIVFNFMKSLKMLILELFVLFSSLINPYGIEAPLYVLKSGIDKNVKESIGELLPIYKDTQLGRVAVMYILILIVIVKTIKYYKKNKQLDMRFIFFSLGGILMAFNACRNYLFTIIFCFMLIAYVSDYNYIESIKEEKNKTDIIMAVIISIFIILSGILQFYSLNKTYKFKETETIGTYLGKEAALYLDDYCEENNLNKEDIHIYSHESLSSALEYYGYKTYGDCRPEALRITMNKKYDYWQEEYDFRTGKIDCKDYLEKYDIQFITATKDYMNLIINSNPEWFNSHYELIQEYKYGSFYKAK